MMITNYSYLSKIPNDLLGFGVSGFVELDIVVNR